MSDIVYQNKDIASKVFADRFKGKQLSVYGLDVPPVKEVLPTNLPDIEANELRIDNLFLFEDGTIGIVDYESKYKEENKVKYLQYIVRILDRYYKQGKHIGDIKIRVIVIYTADVKRTKTKNELDIGCLNFRINEAFLSELDNISIRRQLEEKIKARKQLTDEELMQFIILPLTYKGDKKKQIAIRDFINLAKQIENEVDMIFVLSGIVVFSDKVIDDNTSSQVKEWIKMTKVGRLYDIERERAVEDAIEKTEISLQRKTIRRMIKKNTSEVDIHELTGFPMDLIREEKSKLDKTAVG